MKSRVTTPLALAAVGVMLLVAALWAHSKPEPLVVSPEVARRVRELTARPGLHRRLAVRLAETVNPAGARLLPAFLRPDSIQRHKLEACHALMAMGPAAQIALPRLLPALRDGDSTTAFYVLLVIVYTGRPAAEVMSLARQSPGTTEALVRLCAGLLATEDEPLRDFSWQLLEIAGHQARMVTPRLRDLAMSGDPESSGRARNLLRNLADAEAVPSGL